MSDTIKCVCGKCGAKYRLPAEAQGRTARCKRCGEKFEIPRQQTLEDSILTWLTVPEEDEVEDTAPAQPRIISMPSEEQAGAEADSSHRNRGPIRMKDGNASKTQSA